VRCVGSRPQGYEMNMPRRPFIPTSVDVSGRRRRAATVGRVPVVSASGLRKSFGDVVALDGVDLVVEAGTVHGLLGPNGAGKSTLLRVLLGLVAADQGTVDLPGTVGGFVEAPGAYPYLTGRQNLTLLADLDDHPGDVDEVLRRVELVERADTKVSGWSLGMRQRLGIAAGLLRRPDLLVLDEPANGLDPLGARALRALISELAHEGLAVLLCSHDLAEVDAVCDSVTFVVRGRVGWTGSAADLRARPGRCLLTTSDDAAAVSVGTDLAVVTRAEGIELSGSTESVDRYVLSLAAQGIAVRSLVRESLPLEQAFLELVR
jgi:ABC-2 type transport system ATP-binding protein